MSINFEPSLFEESDSRSSSVSLNFSQHSKTSVITRAEDSDREEIPSTPNSLSLTSEVVKLETPRRMVCCGKHYFVAGRVIIEPLGRISDICLFLRFILPVPACLCWFCASKGCCFSWGAILGTSLLLVAWTFIFWVTAAVMTPAMDNLNITTTTVASVVTTTTSTTVAPFPLLSPDLFDLPNDTSIDYDVGHIFG
jgi:hypothetical protein